MENNSSGKEKNVIKEGHVVIGMSGGVDSAVAAYLLKKGGRSVVGVFMKNWDEKDDNGICTATQDYDDVRSVCDTIGIPYYTVNFEKEYRERVFSYFLDEYRKGRTPNPDVMCNCEIKFKAFLDFALQSGASAIATGHYCRLDEKKRLLKGLDRNKDQSYFLAGLKPQQLEKAIFPVGEMQKKEVREIAAREHFSNALKKDSTGICFIGERNFKNFLMQYLPAQKGKIVDEHGKTIGTHDGLMYYTIGQRRGLGIGGMKDGSGESWFVIGKDLKRNLLIVQQGEHEELYSSELITETVNWTNEKPAQNRFNCMAKFRYRQPDQPVVVELIEENRARVIFDKPQRAVTPGQWAVFYNEDFCLGGAPIDNVKPIKEIKI